MSKTGAPARELKELLQTLLPAQEKYPPVILQEEQEAKLDILRASGSPEHFHFVFDLLGCKLEGVYGVDKALGYPDKEFTVSRYLSCVHPGQSIQFNMIAHAMYHLLCRGVFKLHFLTDSYISLVALRHYSGDYYVFKKTTSIFQYDAKNRLLSQLNEFTRVDVYEHSPLKPRILEMAGMQREEFENRVFAMTFKSFAAKKFFSGRQLEVLRYYAADASVTTRRLADLLEVGTNTINTYNKRILVKAKEIFSHPFSEARDVASYLRKERIL